MPSSTYGILADMRTSTYRRETHLCDIWYSRRYADLSKLARINIFDLHSKLLILADMRTSANRREFTYFTSTQNYAFSPICRPQQIGENSHISSLHQKCCFSPICVPQQIGENSHISPLHKTTHSRRYLLPFLPCSLVSSIPISWSFIHYFSLSHAFFL